MRLQVLETQNIAPITFPSPNDPWPSNEPPPVPYQSNIYAEEREGFALPSSEMPTSTTMESPQQHLQDFITLPPEALLENSENDLVKMVFFSYEGLQDLLQPEKRFTFIDGSYKVSFYSFFRHNRIIIRLFLSEANFLKSKLSSSS